MAEQRVLIEGMYPPGAVLSVQQAVDPSVDGIYSFCLPDTPGVVAANNFVSVSNPVGSGKLVSVIFIDVASYVATTAIAAASMVGYRTTAATGGVDSTASAVKLRTAYPTPSAVVRTGNPTATIVGAIQATSPPLSSGSFTSGAYVSVATASFSSALLLAEGEGFTFRTTSGDANQRWNITFAWAES